MLRRVGRRGCVRMSRSPLMPFRVLLFQPSLRVPSGSKSTVSATTTSTSWSPAAATRVSPIRLRPFLISARPKERPRAALW